MAYKKKLTDNEFVELIIDKELEIAGADMRYADIIKLTKDEQQKMQWWTKYTFKTLEQFLEWRQFFYDNFYDWQPKSVKKSTMEREFQWWNLQWGLKYDFDYEEIAKHDEQQKKKKK